MGWLNRTLPRGEYHALAHIYLGTQIEADVAEFERPDYDPDPGNGDGGLALATEIETAVATVPIVFPDEFEVRVVERTGSGRLVGVIELVSPGNKKESAEREAFVNKCVAYLGAGVGLAVIDVVTERRANLHNELVRRLGSDQPPAVLADEPLYAAGYRPVRRKEQNLLDLWPHVLAVGQPLPRVPFALKGGPTISLDLEATYSDSRGLIGV
jgi:hypothetical protein